MVTKLTSRALNRTLLARQMLLRREDRSIAATVEHLVGMQAQNPTDPYYALWSRLEKFKPAELESMLTQRQAVRCWPMRRTVHLLTARDALVLLTLMRPVAERTLQSGFGKQLAGLDRAEVAAFARKLLEEAPRIRAELIPFLQERWPDCAPQPLSYAATMSLPLVQLPPRGLWSQQSGRAVMTTAEAWLGEPLAVDPSPDQTILRYLAAFGPASNADIRTWSGLTGVHEVTTRLRPELRSFKDDQGRELLDVPDASWPDPDTPTPPRFLPEFDNVFLSHQDRNRIIDPDVRPGSITVDAQVRKLLIDGFVRAQWTITQGSGTATLLVEPYKPLSSREEEEITDEGARLLRFAVPDDTHDIRFAAPAPPNR